MVEGDSRPGRLGDQRIEQRDHAALAIEQRKFHRQVRGVTNLDACGPVVRQTLASVVFQARSFEQNPALDAALGGLFDELFV